MVGNLETTDAGGSIDPREVHEILRNTRRRRVIEQLSRRLEPITLRDLAEKIAAIETGETPPPRKARDSVYNSLHQTHLPKLDELDVIEYDEDRKKIHLRRRAKQVHRYMQVVTDYGISWAQLYRTMGVIALSAIVGTQAELPLLQDVPVLLLTSVFLVLFAVATAYQMWTLRWFYMRSLVGDGSTTAAESN
jgi:hypothetical protein